MKIVFFLIVSCCPPLLYGQATAQGDTSYNIIVNATNSVSEMTKAQISNLFLKKVTKWGNGKTVLPVNLGQSSVIRKQFSKEVIGKATPVLEAYWQQQVFSGREVPPLEKLSAAEVIKYIQDNPDAIGYISKATKLGKSKVKILRIKK